MKRTRIAGKSGFFYDAMIANPVLTNWEATRRLSLMLAVQLSDTLDPGVPITKNLMLLLNPKLPWGPNSITFPATWGDPAKWGVGSWDPVYESTWNEPRPLKYLISAGTAPDFNALAVIEVQREQVPVPGATPASGYGSNCRLGIVPGFLYDIWLQWDGDPAPRETGIDFSIWMFNPEG